jgi:hypothetical protein
MNLLTLAKFMAGHESHDGLEALLHGSFLCAPLSFASKALFGVPGKPLPRRKIYYMAWTTI